MEVISGKMERLETWNVSRLRAQGNGWRANDPTADMVVFQNCDGIRLGAGDPFRATGGLLEGFHIVHSCLIGSWPEGQDEPQHTALSVKALDLGQRPGRYRFADMQVCKLDDLGGSAGSHVPWYNGVEIDGGNLNAVNAAGTREHVIDWLRISGCTGTAFRAFNLVHGKVRGLQVEPLTSGTEQLVIFQNCQHLFINELNVFGRVVFKGCRNVVCSGYATNVEADAKNDGLVFNGMIVEKDLTIDYGCKGRFNGYIRSEKYPITRNQPTWSYPHFKVVSF